jgi:hypothetical protein
MTLIEIKPHRWGWKVFEAPGVETAHYHGRYKGVPGEWHLYAVAQNT